MFEDAVRGIEKLQIMTKIKKYLEITFEYSFRTDIVAFSQKEYA